MKNIFTPIRVVLSTVISAFFFLLTFSTVSFAANSSDFKPIRTEIRDAYTEIEVYADGTRKLKSYLEPAFYLDAEGYWRTISGRIQSSSIAAEGYAWENTTGIYKSWYPAQPGQLGLKTAFNGVEIEDWINPGTAFIVNNKWVKPSSFINKGTASINGSQLLYKEVAPGVTVEFLQENARRKMNVHLESSKALGTIPANASHFVSHETW